MPDFLSAELFDVFIYEDESKISLNPKRNYSALSFRIASENVRFIYDGKTIDADNKTICYVPAGIEYKRVCVKEKLIVFHFRESTPAVREIVIFKSEKTSEFQCLFEEAVKIWCKKSAGYKYMAASIFYEILSELTKEGMLLTKNTDSDTVKAIEIIEQNFNDTGFRVEKIADLLYISETFLRRKFKKYTGKSPKGYLTERRIEEAKKLLESGYFSQKEIAEKCGFSDVKYFRTAFKTATGMKIKEFKEKI